MGDTSVSFDQTQSTESQNAKSTQNLRDFLFHVHGIVGWKDLAKEQELRSLSDILEIVEEGGLSEQKTRALLKTRRVQSYFSYDVLKNYLERRSKVSKNYALMCPLGHMAKRGPSAEGSVCSSISCDLNIVRSQRFWFRYVSDMIAALCREQNSLEELIGGCRRAKRAVMESDLDTFYDFYDGALFRRKYAALLRNWNEEQELFVFLTFSSDGFEEIGGHRGPRTAWPLIFIILNYSPCHRFKARNALLSGFIPGKHDSKFFDTFLEPIVTDLSVLERGCFLTCADGKRRKLRVFMMFVTADYPAASKLLGFIGHVALFPCRYCHKRQEYVPELNGRALIPLGHIEQRSKAMSLQSTNNYEWIDLECGLPRTDRQTREIWGQLDAIPTSNISSLPKAKKELRTSTGISRRPILGRLHLDFVHSLPYDPMHLVFLGWVKHLLLLLFGIHGRTTADSTYVISQPRQKVMNEALIDGAKGIPAPWGRASESLEHIATFKAEDFKNFGMFYGPILFSGQDAPQWISRLWGTTSNIVHIICDPSPALSDVEILRRLLQEAHALFSACFYLDEHHALFFTPNTHAMLHLADMLRECGPLTNVSQFTVERLIGALGDMVGSKVRPEANLFHKTHTLFSYRLLSGGMSSLKDGRDSGDGYGSSDEFNVGDDESTEEETHYIKNVHYTPLGSGKEIVNPSKTDLVKAWLEEKLGGDTVDLESMSIWSHERASVNTFEAFMFETESHFNSREQRAAYTARQKFWIAGHFDERDGGIQESTGASEESETAVYYGKVVEIWNVMAFTTNIDERSEEKSFVLVTIDWQYGISTDRFTGMMSVRNGKGPRRGSVRHVDRSIEDIGCVNRLIGVFDYHGRKFFMDNQRWRLSNCKGMALKGQL